MISAELRDWLDKNAEKLLSNYLDDDFDSPIPEGWSFDEKCVAHYGGQDQGSDYWTVWRFKNGDTEVLIRVDGWYQSYHGAEFNGYREVIARQKTITVYE